MAAYATPQEYAALSRSGEIPTERLSACLEDASRDVDTLTFGRIRKSGFSMLTEFQQEMVRLAVVRQADFSFNYRDLLGSPLASYGINGVSMGFDKAVLISRGGVSTMSDIDGLLEQAGLTCRRLT